MPLRAAQPFVKGVRVEGRRRRHRQHIAGLGIHHHDRRAPFLGDALGDELLQPHVDGEVQVLPRLPVLAAQFADHAAKRIDLNLGVARGAAHLQVVLPLDAILADAEAGQLKQRIAGQFAFGDRRHIAERMRRVAAERVEALLAHVDVDAWQVGGVDLDAADLFPAQILAHGDRHEGAAAAHLAHDALALFFRHLDQPVQAHQHLLHVVGLFRHDDDAVILNVDRQRHVVAVKHPAARRRQQAQADAVFLGQHPVAVGFHDLEVVHAAGQPGEQHALGPRPASSPGG